MCLEMANSRKLFNLSNIFNELETDSHCYEDSGASEDEDSAPSQFNMLQEVFSTSISNENRPLQDADLDETFSESAPQYTQLTPVTVYQVSQTFSINITCLYIKCI